MPAMLIGAFQRGAPQRLGQQVVTQRRTEFALRLAVQHRHVLIALGRQLQFALGIEFAQGEIAQAFVTHAALERRALVTAYPLRE